MAESMIEKVARAIEAHSPKSDWPTAEEVRTQARAAIEAMRTPSPAIIEAAEDIAVGYDDFAIGDGNIYLGIPGYPRKATEVWEKLIDAALKETNP